MIVIHNKTLNEETKLLLCSFPSLLIFLCLFLLIIVWRVAKKKKEKIYFQVKSVSFPGKQKLIFFFVNLFKFYRDEMKQRGRMTILVTNIASIVLFALMVFASIESKSLSIIASILDLFFDLLWGFILWLTFHAMQNPNPHKYPIGKKRMQPVVNHSTQQLWGCIWKHFNLYLNLRLSLPAISLISFSAIVKSSVLFSVSPLL